MKFIIERWKTENSRKKEIHYYVSEDTYVFGINPKFFKKDAVSKILKLIIQKPIIMKKPKPVKPKKPKY